MNNKILAFIGLNLMLLLSHFSCTICGPFPDKFRVKSVEWETGMVVSRDMANLRSAFTSLNADSVSYDLFSVSMRPDIELFGFNCNINPSFSLISQAYACSPKVIETSDLLTNLQITSPQNFSPIFPKGSDLNELFSVFVIDDANSVEAMMELNDYIKASPEFPNRLFFLLNEAPEVEGEYVFEFKLKLAAEVIDSSNFKSRKIFISK